MNKFFATATALAALITVAGAAAPASAQTTASLGWSRVDGDNVGLDAVTGRLSTRWGWIGVEGELSGGVGSDTIAGAKVRLNHEAAIYATGTVPISDNFDLFARVGYGTTKISGGGLSESEESWNYGVGGQYFFDGKNGARADYTREDFNHGLGNADVWSLSYVRRF